MRIEATVIDRLIQVNPIKIAFENFDAFLRVLVSARKSTAPKVNATAVTAVAMAVSWSQYPEIGHVPNTGNFNFAAEAATITVLMAPSAKTISKRL